MTDDDKINNSIRAMGALLESRDADIKKLVEALVEADKRISELEGSVMRPDLGDKNCGVV